MSKRLRVGDLDDERYLAGSPIALARRWNGRAHWFNWTTKSSTKGPPLREAGPAMGG